MTTCHGLALPTKLALRFQCHHQSQKAHQKAPAHVPTHTSTRHQWCAPTQRHLSGKHAQPKRVAFKGARSAALRAPAAQENENPISFARTEERLRNIPAGDTSPMSSMATEARARGGGPGSGSEGCNPDWYMRHVRVALNNKRKRRQCRRAWATDDKRSEKSEDVMDDPDSR